MRPQFRICRTGSIGIIRATVLVLFAMAATGLSGSQTLAPGAHAQRASFDATRLSQPTPLGGIWLVHGGDDSAFADPRLDDSQWIPFDISKPLQTLFPAGKPGVVWYRLHMEVATGQNDLAIRETHVSKAFAVYANGVELLKAGSITPYIAYNTYAPLIARIPEAQVANGSFVLAVRVHLDEKEWEGKNPGLYPDNLRLGVEEQLLQQRSLRFLHTFGEQCVEALLQILLSLAGAILYSTERHRKEYLWLSLYALSSCLYLLFTLYSHLQVYPETWDILQAPLQFGMFWFPFPMYFAFVHHRMRPWIMILIAICCVGGAITNQPALNPLLKFYLGTPANLLLILLIPAVLIMHWRRGNREAAILLFPVLLLSGSYLVLGPIMFHLALGHPYTPTWVLKRIVNLGIFSLSFLECASILSWLVLGLIILLRSNRMSRKAALHEGQLAAAREIQQLLLPEKTELIPGFVIDTAYVPAQHVGGDFFQLIPTDENGMLIVIGDVAGKGLPAAMMVSVLVGAIRTLASFTHDPAEVLAQLNERLIRRTGGGFSTASAAYIGSDGVTTIANAGHLSPYLDGNELDLPGALPLGLLPGVTYETTGFTLKSGSRLTFYSDRVIEAQNYDGDLLGFERGRELSKQSVTAIVEAAQSFGQIDDITVVTIART